MRKIKTGPKRQPFANYRIINDKDSEFYITNEKEETFTIKVDTEDLYRLIEFNHPWNIYWNGWHYYARCNEYLGVKDGKAIYKIHSLHRWILNVDDKRWVDHIDILNTLDNRKSNLRASSAGENLRNKNGAYITSKTGFRNVCFIPKYNQYWVQFLRNGERYKWVFPADKFDEACKFAEEKRKELFGDFAGNSIRQPDEQFPTKPIN